MGALADALDLSEGDPHPNAGCVIGRMWHQLDDDDRAALTELTFTGVLTNPQRQRRLLAATGVDVKPHAWGEHRRSRCSCASRGWAQPDG